jgi:quinolinate synthase
MNKDTLVLAHYYTIPEVQAMADYVGDSLELAQRAKDSKAKRIVFAGVRFMAETTKMLNPNAQVILPSAEASCSLVDQTDITELGMWTEMHREKARQEGKELSHVMYINSSVEMKAYADIIVTSRNVDDVIKAEIDAGKYVIFSPDSNMGKYLNYQYDYNIPVWTAVCDVHDKFKEEEINAVMMVWTDGPKFLLAHPESPLPVLKRADVVGSTSKMLQWVKDYPRDQGTRAHVVVATEDGLLYNMREARPDLDIIQAPVYDGCKCVFCPFMKTNTINLVQQSIDGSAGVEIDYLTDEAIARAIAPVNRMLDFNSK